MAETQAPKKANGDNRPGLPVMGAAALALVSGVGALTLTGTLGRVQRNNGTLFAVAVALVVVGAAIWIAGAMIHTEARKIKLRGRNFGWREVVQVLGVVLSLLGVTLGFVAAISTANDAEQPDVSIDLSAGGRAASGTATVSDLSSQDRLAVFVDGLAFNGKGGYAATNLYRAFVGPNGDGKASNKFHVMVPPGHYDALGVRAFTKVSQECGTYPRGGTEFPGTGCVIVRLPEHPSGPFLTANWERKTRTAQVVSLTVAAVDAGTGASGRLLQLSVTGLHEGRRVLIYRTAMEPSPTGTIKRRVRLPIGRDVRRVCARADLVRSGAKPPFARCPVPNRSDGAFAELRLPAR